MNVLRIDDDFLININIIKDEVSAAMEIYTNLKSKGDISDKHFEGAMDALTFLSECVVEMEEL